MEAAAWVKRGIILNGTHYLFSGDSVASELVVCVHGIGSYHTCFDQLVPHLVKGGYRTLQYDLIGRGFSEPSGNGRYGAEEHIQQLDQLVRDLQLPSFHVVAHSMGGALAALYTIQHKDMVKSLTLVAPAGLMNSFPLSLLKSGRCLHGVLRGSLSARSNAEKAWRDDFYSHEGEALVLEEEMVRSQHLMYDHNPEAFNAFFTSVLQFPLYGLEAEVKQLAQCDGLPFLLLWGRADKAVPYACCKRWTKLLQSNGAKLVVKKYLKAAHGLLAETHEEVGRDIVDFLAAH